MADETQLASEIPLTETHFLVLLTMVKPNHGYGVMQEVEVITHGRVTFGPGTLYGAINNLSKKGWIEMVEHDKKNRRKIYQTTTTGRKLLELEFKRMKQLIEASQDYLREGES
ncbi:MULTISPECIES: PadR family transcriptional regulator [Aerococcus]|uniref:Helix-turn-helix transcriptional regulator n=1 Tax=Aerococcus urinae TaxID=1376 RepID=A0A109RE43_9LACT|nr:MULTISPECIES: helix-turn-helix transcriptional regulator [Aerococcus]AMB95080.1 PadR family transcriptional regulator [Aerococcus urinae]MCY3031793.1 helix-turn-helix transcriptional regulator [Aerococcus urinae]MCY3037213.1 helix-turn-helix transcriptional regulator [Aerococcus urinae]MCY3043840.1 helix-turn-helix transcriptional regulator [Aerococcus urinae]MCY3046515.1 helix-turn-helix transcriptional regulator [Aerococcus urinae]